MKITFSLPTELKTLALGAALVRHAIKPSCIFLKGDLGAGKTTLVRGFLRALNYTAAVKSPTYPLVECYELSENISVAHFDLYRLTHVAELEQIGIDEYISEADYTFIEWPEQGFGQLPPADITCWLKFDSTGTREACLEAGSEQGKSCLVALSQDKMLFDSKEDGMLL